MSISFKVIAMAAVLGLSMAGGAWAQAVPVDGSVEKIDQDAGKITLKHGQIKNLDMDAMTMVFRVQDPEVLKKLKVGQKVKFEADRINGQITITKIGPEK